ncbi:hypothetical protein SAMN05444161_8516 [Rhizobiales bacterium GAS191]|nr:hypothetical protein SAMN05444161_8516 [Rhizobiales bacterium GAS191]
MSLRQYVLLLATTALLAGCGTYVPGIAEFPGNQVEGQKLVRAIVASVHCEMRNAISYTINQDKSVATQFHQPRSAPWLDKWGVQVALTITVDEKTLVNPNTVWTRAEPVSALFTLSGGTNISSDATRIDKLNYYYTVKELYDLGACTPDETPNRTVQSLLIQSDLKLKEWLLSQTVAVGTGDITVPTGISTPLKQNALSHEVKFEVVSGGNLTPGWKLAHATINQSGLFLSASRDRTHDLLMTFGPIDPATKGLVGAAADSNLASLIGIATNGSRISISP